MVSCLLLMSLVPGAQATELDSFTYRGDSVPDATAILDAETQWRITEAVQKANREGECEPRTLYHELGQQLRAGAAGVYMVAPLEFYANYSPDVPRLRFSRSESIYRDIWLFQSVPITLYPLGHLIRVDDVVIAGDKFSHFFNVGWEYFKRLGEDQDDSVAINFGLASENGLWGMTTTGVFSFADLVSNYEGMVFWRDFISQGDQTSISHVECRDQQWVEVRTFHWRDWVNDGWDEAINCSVFAERMRDRVMDAISNPVVEGAASSCQATQEFCSDTMAHYGEAGQHMLTPICQQLLNSN